MDDEKNPVAWSTAHELHFLQNMTARFGNTRIEMLTMYAQAIRRRANWGEIDKAKVLDFLADEVTSEALEEALSTFRQAQA